MAFPKKLTNDAITSVAFEIRYESSDLEEIIVGRIADWAQKKFQNVEIKRSGAADIPLPLRKSNEQLRYQSTLDFAIELNPSSSRLIRTGNAVLGYILQGDYCGWDSLELEIFDAIDALITQVAINKVIRLGLRYTNALRPDIHFISGLSDVNLELSVSGNQITDMANINFSKQVGKNHQVLSRILTPNFWTAPTPPNTALVADFDVATVTELDNVDPIQIKNWISQAHGFEIEAFAAILPATVIEKLRET